MVDHMMNASETDNQPGLINTNVDGIGHFLSDRLLAIPDYQRSYSWGEIEVAELWADLQKAQKSNSREYFLGSVVTTASPGASRQLVIDGQQRLATIALLFAAMRDILRERVDERASDVERDFLGRKDMKTRKILPNLTLNADDNQFYLGLIRGEEPQASRESHSKLENAYKILHARECQLIEDLPADSWQDPLMELLEFVRYSAKIIDVHVPDENRSFVIFETLNDRGLNLNTADLLKNHLFGTAGKNYLEETKRRWSEMVGALGSDDRDGEIHDKFLRHFWSSKTGTARAKALFSEIRDTVKEPEEAVALATELSISAPLWAGMFDPDSELWRRMQPSARENLRVLKNLKVEQCRPLIMAVMRNFDSTESAKVTNCVLNWAVRWFVTGGGGAGVTERLYAETAKKVSDGQIKSAVDVISEMKIKVPSDSDFKRAFSALTVRRGWLARYLLHALERTARKGIRSPELSPNQDWEEANLEHVLPKSYVADKWSQFSSEEHASWYLSLGNQAILARSDNEIIGNESFDIKGPILKQSSLVLTAEIGNSANWTVGDIMKRQERLAELAVITWPITL